MKKEKTTFGDRFAASFIMFLASFITAIIVWGFVFLFVGRGGELFLFPFSFVIYATVFFTLLAFISPNLSLVSMSWVWGKLGKFFKAANKSDTL